MDHSRYLLQGIHDQAQSHNNPVNNAGLAPPTRGAPISRLRSTTNRTVASLAFIKVIKNFPRPVSHLTLLLMISAVNNSIITHFLFSRTRPKVAGNSWQNGTCVLCHLVHMNISFRLAREYISGGYTDFGGYFGDVARGGGGRERRLRRVSRGTNKRCCDFL